MTDKTPDILAQWEDQSFYTDGNQTEIEQILHERIIALIELIRKKDKALLEIGSVLEVTFNLLKSKGILSSNLLSECNKISLNSIIPRALELINILDLKPEIDSK